MRWIWIDRFIEFETGRRAVAIKNLSLAEEHLHDHFPGHPVMPGSLIIEGLAQTAGLLVGEARSFEEKVVLAKIPKMTFHGPARPGETLTYTAVIDYIQDDGAMATVTSHVGERLQAEGEIVFAHLRDDGRQRRQFEPKNFVFTLKLLGVFDVSDKTPYPPGLEKLKREV